jgi:hypothetical protein
MVASTLATFIILMGCTSEEKLTPDTRYTETVNKVKVKLGKAVTRADTGVAPTQPVLDGVALNPESGYLYFTDSDGNITLWRQILTDGMTSGNIIKLSDLETGVVISDVSSASTTCYVFMNLPDDIEEGDLALNPEANISAVIGLSLSVDSLADAAGGVANVPLRGKGAITPVTGDSGYQLEATVFIYAVASRIEIVKLSGEASTNVKTNDSKPFLIESFKVAGIFVNNYFATSPLGGLITAGSLEYNDAIADYNPGGGTFKYGTAAPYLYTYYDPVVEGSPATSYGPPDNKVWAYNVFPNDTIGINTPEFLPHIIIKLAEVVYYPEGQGGDVHTLTNQFITVSGYIDNNTKLDYLEKGYIYSFEDIAFSLDILSPVPEAKLVNAHVQIVAIPWRKKVVTPDF